jgi:hypothetical protein
MCYVSAVAMRSSDARDTGRAEASDAFGSCADPVCRRNLAEFTVAGDVEESSRQTPRFLLTPLAGESNEGDTTPDRDRVSGLIPEQRTHI